MLSLRYCIVAREISVSITSLDADIPEENVMVTLKDILVFSTGTDRVPPGGFYTQPKISFLSPDPSQVLATASTCELCLRLLTIYADNAEKFEDYFTFSLKGYIGFGTV